MLKEDSRLRFISALFKDIIGAGMTEDENKIAFLY